MAPERADRRGGVGGRSGADGRRPDTRGSRRGRSGPGTPAGRVIAGRAGGRRLVGPGCGTRPLSDRAKEALFGILDPELPAARVLDCFAGSGAAGIEALSRGASRVVFVDRSAAAATVIEANLRATGLAGPAAMVRRRDVLAYLAGEARGDGPFDLVLVDPPYAEPSLALAVLETLGRGEIVRSGGLVVIRTFWRTGLPEAVGLLRSERERRIGEGVLRFYRAGEPPAPGETAAQEDG